LDAPRAPWLAGSAPKDSPASISRGHLQSRQRLIQRQMGQRLSGRKMNGAEPLEARGMPEHSIGQAAEIRELHIAPSVSGPDACGTTVALAELTDGWFHSRLLGTGDALNSCFTRLPVWDVGYG